MLAPGPKRRPHRETVTTINQDGSRFFLHPSDVSGAFARGRRVVAALLIALYVALPWVHIGGMPAVFIDVLNRRFHLFGLTFAPQDLWLLFFLITGVAFVLFFVTALFGRLWCGWACPQTVFLEQVFRRIERWVEGDAPERRRLDAAPWSGSKLAKRVVKHGVFIVLSAAIAHVFLAYFVSIPELYAWMVSSPVEHWGAFVFVTTASGFLYFNFVWFREQLCLVICPYGRLQAALIDEHTLTVAYDAGRGEPRGKTSLAGVGDCVDCNRCVQVCPTGIDIRQGQQMECIACTACIDACNTIMDKLGRPRGLIRYASERGLEGKKPRILRARTVVYGILMLVGLGVMAFSFSGLRPFEASVSRLSGQPYYVTDAYIRNQFQLRLVNKQNEAVSFQISLRETGRDVELVGWGEPVKLEALEEQTRPLIVVQPRPAYAGHFPLRIAVEIVDGGSEHEYQVEFIGPDPRFLLPRGE